MPDTIDFDLEIVGRSEDCHEFDFLRPWMCTAHTLDSVMERVDIGRLELYVVPYLDWDVAGDCDDVSQSLSTLMAELCDESHELTPLGCILLIDRVEVEERYRGQSLGTAMIETALNFFSGMVAAAALLVTKEKPFRKAALKIPKKLKFKKLKGDVWYRDLTIIAT